MEPTKQGYFDVPVCQAVEYEGDGRGVLLMHGFTGSPAHMRLVAEGLKERGLTVKSICLPGHASTEEEMAKADWKLWLQAAKEAALSMMERCDTLTVCGLSMGGVLALLVAQQMKVDACVTISAPMATKNKALCLSKPAALFVKRISWSAQPQRRHALDSAYDYGYSGFPTAKGADLYHLIRLARKNLFNITCPVLCVQSDGDETVWEGSADYILEHIASEKKWKLLLHDVPHVCTISKEAPAIVEGIFRVIQEVSQEKAENVKEK